MASQYKNITVDGKEIDSKGSLFQVLDNSDSGLPKNIPNVFKCNLARQDGSYKFFKNGLPVVWFAKLEDGRYERLATTESVLYKNADDVYFVDEAFNITDVAYCLYEHDGSQDAEYMPAKIKELLENDEFTILSGDNFEHANADSKFTILAEDEITSEKLARGFVGCYNCNDGYPNNLEDCPYCSGRGYFYGNHAGWYPFDGELGKRKLQTEIYLSFLLHDENEVKKYFNSCIAWQLAKDKNPNDVLKGAYEQLADVSVLLNDQVNLTDETLKNNKNFNIEAEGFNNPQKICEVCDGRGYIDGIYQKCFKCNGNGYYQANESENDTITWKMCCVHCNDNKDLSKKLGVSPFDSSYSKLTYNMTDTSMPILRGKRIKNGHKHIGYNECNLCNGRGSISKTSTGIKTNLFFESTVHNVYDNKKHYIYDSNFGLLNAYVIDNTVKKYYYLDKLRVIDYKSSDDFKWQYIDVYDNTVITFNAFDLMFDCATPDVEDTCYTCHGSGIVNDSLTNKCCRTCLGVGKLHTPANVYSAVPLASLRVYSIKTSKWYNNFAEYLHEFSDSENPGSSEEISFTDASIHNRDIDFFKEKLGDATELDWDYGYGNIKSLPIWEYAFSAWGFGGYQYHRGPYEVAQGFGTSILGYAPCPQCFNSAYFVNNTVFGEHPVPYGRDEAAELSAQQKLFDIIVSGAKENGQIYHTSFNQAHNYTEDELKTNFYADEIGVESFCDTCNPNGIPETHFKDGLIVSPNSQGIYPEGTETVVGLIDCNTCGNNGLEAGEMVCTGCLGIRHWFCTTCSGDGEVEYRPTVAYEDGKKVAVGDGYYYENLFPNATSAFNLYKDYINIKPNNNCDIGRGEYIKKMNLFSVENNGLLTVHNNNYDDVPTSDVKHNINRDFFAVRDWAKYDSLDERFANLQNCCYAPDAIYFPKRTAHNEEWKLRIRELYYLITDSYIKTNASMLKTNALNQAIADFYTNNTTYLLKLGPIITYAIKGVWRKGAKGSKGVKGVTAGTKGKKGMKGLKGLKGTKGAKGYYEKIVIENKRYKYTLPDILNAIYTEYGQRIMNSGNLGKDDKTYTFYCINEDSENYLWFKGVRIRQLTKGRYQTLNVVKGCKPYGVQRIVYKNNGYNGEYGVMNFQYSRNREFLT